MSDLSDVSSRLQIHLQEDIIQMSNGSMQHNPLCAIVGNLKEDWAIQIVKDEKATGCKVYIRHGDKKQEYSLEELIESFK